MRPLCLLLLLLPALASAAPAAPAANAPDQYAPKFARITQPAEILSWDLCPKPGYPRASIRNEETGVVTLGFTVAASGHLLGATVARSSGFPNLDNAAYAALTRCRFRPASLDGQPVQASMQVQYVWTLD
ncbi:energy transducer TonB [Massilia sp. YIM B02769]|uniref:energy transducer TonB n=1 Tax=Massilia sp. YIM B02769 TaxID=3050129 RepID=UPI0025B6CD36|nr:energy transducer TonB [Massilia sp. YIM B02769]MDN4058642.1 energy transducer TonB [Massilia sp. YIM B02769]